MMQSHIRGDAAFARPFKAIRAIGCAPENIVTGASFSSPRPPMALLQVALAPWVEIFFQENKP